MRVHFELKYGADTVAEATEAAYEQIAKFMEVQELAVPALVDVELKVSLPDPEKDKDLNNNFLVTAFGNVKHSIVKPSI
jgi:hypothetical protein